MPFQFHQKLPVFSPRHSLFMITHTKKCSNLDYLYLHLLPGLWSTWNQCFKYNTTLSKRMLGYHDTIILLLIVSTHDAIQHKTQMNEI